VPVIRSCETVNWISVSVKAKLRELVISVLVRDIGKSLLLIGLVFELLSWYGN
jgi:hypothetical protein